MPKKQRYGGLLPRHVRLIRSYLRQLSDIESGTDTWKAYTAWTWLVIDPASLDHVPQAEAGINKSTINALKAGLEVLKRKRIGRIWDWNPHKSFAALGITATASRPHGQSASNSDQKAQRAHDFTPARTRVASGWSSLWANAPSRSRGFPTSNNTQD